MKSPDDTSCSPNDKEFDTLESKRLKEKEQKRLKHREYVRKSYNKKISTIQSLKEELGTLENQYASLVQHQKQVMQIESPCKTSSLNNNHLQGSLLQNYLQAMTLKKQLNIEYDALYQESAARMKVESRVQQLLDAISSSSPPVCKGNTLSSQFEESLQKECQKKSQVNVPAPPLPINSPPTSQLFRFTPLSDAEYTQIITRTRDEVYKFLISPDKKSTGAQVFGWRDQQQILNKTNELQFAIEKFFPNQTAWNLVENSWDKVFTNTDVFPQIYSQAIQPTFHIIQKINNDTNLYFRKIRFPTFIAKTVFLCTRLRVDIGYLVLFRSIDPETLKFEELLPFVTSEVQCASLHEINDTTANSVWVDKSIWLLFQDTVRPLAELHHHSQGFSQLTEKSNQDLDNNASINGCLFHFGGATKASMWLKELLFIAIRWENIVVGPTMRLLDDK